MYFPFFKSEFKDTGVSCKTHTATDIHREITQKIQKKPDLAGLEQGFIICPNCGWKVFMSDNAPLSISKCAGCSNTNFIPMLLKDYWVYEPLGGGGMGSVYHAFHRRIPEVESALKLLPRDKKDNRFLIKSLLTEAETGSKFCRHPHLMRVYESGLWQGEYYAVYEYVDGTRLDQIIESPLKRPDKQILLWALQILSAEQHMFDCGYLFRDLKPQNVIIDGNGNAKLIDYGLAISVDEARSGNKTDEIIGSPLYMPPERITGGAESQNSEIYSLGMLFYHMIARQPFYSTDDIKRLLERHVVSLRMNNVSVKLPAHTDPEIIKILNKMITRNPSTRYQTYRELGIELFRVYKKCA